VYVVGGAGLAKELTDAGFHVVTDCNGDKIDYVVVGLDEKSLPTKSCGAHQSAI